MPGTFVILELAPQSRPLGHGFHRTAARHARKRASPSSLARQLAGLKSSGG